MTWQETGDRVTKLAAGLVALGIEPEQRVGIASGTRFEWILADLAIMCAGGATTTVYPSTMADDVAYILADSECRVVFAEDDSQVAKLLRAASPSCRTSTKVVTFDGAADGDWVIALDRPREARRGAAGRRPRASSRTAIAATQPRLAGHADLHLRHHRPAQGRPAPPHVLDLRGRGDPGPGHPRRGRPAVPVAADGALVRQGAALHPARVRLRRPPSTAGSTRSSTTSPS